MIGGRRCAVSETFGALSVEQCGWAWGRLQSGSEWRGS